jgi:hypothetical protein
LNCHNPPILPVDRYLCDTTTTITIFDPKNYLV